MTLSWERGRVLIYFYSKALSRFFSRYRLIYKSGPLGVGKTFTVEAVSEHLKRPLYSVGFLSYTLQSISLIDQISIRELLRNIIELENRLSRIFKTTSHWNAILLLDKADIFLERYILNNLTRNGLVSVFLRKLEYYEGILFLITNRVIQFDKAVLSRIHILLRYKGLNKVARI